MENLNEYMSGFLLMLLSMGIGFGVIACEGPSGSEGPQGPQGEVGPIGPAGEDGSLMYAGPTAPTADIGNEGDYYLNTTSGEYYGPKDDEDWGNPIIVLMGESGEDGSVIHSGDGSPNTDMGVPGDYYFDQSSGDFYGPKTENGWGSPTNLTGIDGQDGADGSVIHAGVGAPEADLGKSGDYYFDESTGNFYGPKTENGWGGPINLMGEDGQDGADGQDGSQILSGNGAPNASLGIIGDYYLDKDSYELYGPKTSNGWGTPLNLKGADGNANVTRYIFPGHDFTTNDINLEFDGPTYNITDSNMRESAWYVYFVASSGSVYHIPGYGMSQSTHYSAHHTYQGVVMYMSLRVVDGPGEEYEEIEVVRVESSDTIGMTKQKSQNIFPDDLDTSNYQEVAKYYGFYK